MSQRWKSPGGMVTIPGDVPDNFPPPVFIETFKASSGQVITTSVKNKTDVRLYVAGCSNMQFPAEWFGVLEPAGQNGDEIFSVTSILPYNLWVIPENWDPKSLTLLERQELYSAGYEKWRKKHEAWVRDRIQTTPEIFTSKVKKQLKPQRRLRRLEAE